MTPYARSYKAALSRITQTINTNFAYKIQSGNQTTTSDIKQKEHYNLHSVCNYFSKSWQGGIQQFYEIHCKNGDGVLINPRQRQLEKYIMHSCSENEVVNKDFLTLLSIIAKLFNKIADRDLTLIFDLNSCILSDSQLKQIRKAISPFKVINITTNIYPKDHWADDYFHLNYIGREKYTKRIVRLIKNNFIQ